MRGMRPCKAEASWELGSKGMPTNCWVLGGAWERCGGEERLLAAELRKTRLLEGAGGG